MVDELVIELGNKKRATVQEFKGRKLVNIREFYEKDGEMLPGRKGIALTVEQWTEFQKAIPSINKALGGNPSDEESESEPEEAKPSKKAKAEKPNEKVRAESKAESKAASKAEKRKAVEPEGHVKDEGDESPAVAPKIEPESPPRPAGWPEPKRAKKTPMKVSAEDLKLDVGFGSQN